MIVKMTNSCDFLAAAPWWSLRWEPMQVRVSDWSCAMDQ